jgi:DNA repair exonuclease SbcCD nuclease subunit
MNSKTARILFVADTHLGFDLPFRPRVERRRRGHDFFANFERALEPAHRGEVDLVLHGGDLLYRTRVPAALVEMALEPLIQVAEAGVPVYLVPGNHERSRIPLHLWGTHPNLHVFDRPRTFVASLPQGTIGLAGFPFRRRVRDTFTKLVDQTGYSNVSVDAHLLCIHQVVEGAQVGTHNYTFRGGHEVIRGQDIPTGFAAILSGHIHRAQVLTHDLRGRKLAAPVVFPGSIERTSFAERDEEKGYAVVSIDVSGTNDDPAEVSFVPLPARPMVDLVLDLNQMGDEPLEEHLKKRIQALDPNAVVRVQVRGDETGEVREVLSAPYLRSLAPESMNISLAIDRTQFNRRR